MTAVASRRVQLCDAAITVIAGSGLRGLTHRAVDRETGLPEGSTSYYFRTRHALLSAVTQRLAEADLTDQGAVPAGDVNDLDVIADRAAAVVAHFVGPGRDRMLARYEISLEASRQPALRAMLVDAGQVLRTAAAEGLAAAGAPDPVRQGRDLVACMDGLVFDQLAGVGGARPAEEVRATIRDLLRGMIGR